MSLALLVLALGMPEPQDAPTRPAVVVETPAWNEAVRCAGLTQAASELDGQGDAERDPSEAKQLYDSGLYWSLTAMRAARTAGRAEAAAEADQTRARAEALTQLRADSSEAGRELARCLARTPTLD